jgi:DNA-binding CsgD family transcriptional regulator
MRADTWLDEILDLAYLGISDEAELVQLLARLRRDFGAVAAALISHDFRAGKGAWALEVGLDDRLRQRYAEYYAERNPWLGDPPVYENGRVHVGHSIIPSWELVRTEFYCDYLRPQDCYHRLCGVPLRLGHETIFLTVMRAPAQVEFDDRDVADLQRLLPHLGRSLHLRHHLLRRCARQGPLRELLDALPAAVWIVDGDRRLVTMNAAAEAQLARGVGLRLVGGRLVAAGGSDPGGALRRAIHAAALAPSAGGSAGGRVTVPLGHGHQPLMLHVSPLGARTDAGGQLAQPERLVAIIGLGLAGDDGEAVADLAGAYGLTQAEARLCGQLLSGADLAEAAARLGVSRNTVRTQLRRVFAKTGAHSQAALMRLIGGMAPSVARNDRAS